MKEEIEAYIGIACFVAAGVAMWWHCKEFDKRNDIGDKCEGCGEPHDGFDTEGTPLCNECGNERKVT